MPSRRFAALLITVLFITGCAPRVPAPEPTSFPGFDTWRYPGADVMRIWSETSPYQWVGYYLPSPCHRGTSWAGKRTEIEQAGFGIAVLYVGQQTWDGVPELEEEPDEIICSRTLLTAEQGQRDGQDAVDKMRQEGFPPESIVYLNIERMETIPASMVAYYTNWLETVLADGDFTPGTYAHRRNAEALFGHARVAFEAANRIDLPPFWVAGGPDFSLDSRPQDSGLPFATIWQGALDVQRTWGGEQLKIDENVSLRPYPSAPPTRAAQSPRSAEAETD